MPFEIYMYGILAAVWLVLGARSIDRIKLFTIAILTSTVASGVILLMGHLFLCVEIEGWFIKLFFMFFSGASFYVLKDKITLSRTAFWHCAMALMATTLLDKQLFFAVYVFTIAYVIFHLVYVPSGPIRRYNRLGDYSYGMYIYAFPIQQAVIALLPGVSVPALIALSSIGTLAMAMLSWHFIEKHSLKLRRSLIDYTRANTFVSFVRSGR